MPDVSLFIKIVLIPGLLDPTVDLNTERLIVEMKATESDIWALIHLRIPSPLGMLLVISRRSCHCHRRLSVRFKND